MYVDSARCAGCGVCAEACPRGAIRVLDGVARINPALCIECGICARVCPNEAVQAARLPVIPWGRPFTTSSRLAALSPTHGEDLATLKAQTDALREQAGELIRRIDELRASSIPASREVTNRC
jgi:ferredoxin